MNGNYLKIRILISVRFKCSPISKITVCDFKLKLASFHAQSRAHKLHEKIYNLMNEKTLLITNKNVLNSLSQTFSLESQAINHFKEIIN